MSSPFYEPSTADIVFVYDGTNEAVYQVVQVQPNQVYIESIEAPGTYSLLERTPQGWKVYGSNFPYQLHFQNIFSRAVLPPWRTGQVSPQQATVERAPEGTVYGEGCVASLVGRSNEDRYISGLLNGNVRFYVVFDGHGGKQTVNLLRDQFPEWLAQALLNVNMNDANAVQQAVQGAIDQFEEEVIRPVSPDDGSTMVLALITDQHIYLVNLGDSRGILFNDIGTGYGMGQPPRIVAETVDHEPGVERERIEAAGGFVTSRTAGFLTINRVFGQLAISRAFGDLDYKIGEDGEYSQRGPVSLQADVTQHLKTPANRQEAPLFLLLASDGLFEQSDYMRAPEATNQEIVEEATTRFTMYGEPALSVSATPTILPRAKEERDILSSCQRLAEQARQRATDDITVMIVKV